MTGKEPSWNTLLKGFPGPKKRLKSEKKTRKILEGLENRREHLIPLLREIQAGFGYLPHPSMIEVAHFLDISEMKVYSVATSYNQFRPTPPGKHSIRVCMGTKA
jgi:NADH-quinone oxidoreductase subunit E